ncbi:hypothetical protein FJT64_020787 [Amphibalanus amphitrite]|uniref:Uncharacterized protein n=1 Tax=Amphibalanus amphitrite TaxID=1232801 RepID=A0A6A4WWC1_AMPAM|nr:hypothetical protein FJT64_020787 [Amphibalanus amphitrite]
MSRRSDPRRPLFELLGTSLRTWHHMDDDEEEEEEEGMPEQDRSDPVREGPPVTPREQRARRRLHVTWSAELCSEVPDLSSADIERRERACSETERRATRSEMRTVSLPNLSQETEELKLANGVVIVFSHLLASNKADYGLDELQHLNVKDRFSVFERANSDELEKTPTSVEVKRSQSILDKMKKFDRTAAREAASPEESEDSGDEGRDRDTVRSSTKKERPIGLAGLGDVKSRFERGGATNDSDPDPAKGEAAKLRGMICGVSTGGGRQGRHSRPAVTVRRGGRRESSCC